jgi:hypothetical protein
MRVLLVTVTAGLFVGATSMAQAQGSRGSGGGFRSGSGFGRGTHPHGFGSPGFHHHHQHHHHGPVRPFGGFTPLTPFVPEPVVVQRPVFVPQEAPSQPVSPPTQPVQPATNEPVAIAPKTLTAGYYTVTGMGTAYLQPSLQPGVYIITQIAPTASGKIYTHGYYTVSGLGTAYIQPSQALICPLRRRRRACPRRRCRWRS